ncbi:MAG: alpha/beta fold hydrolase [Desulfovibrio sp.]|nr:alpha/beta fold hydrolase [Desulfovibrio sp.]
MRLHRTLVLLVLFLAITAIPGAAFCASAGSEQKPITLSTMGSLFFGGTVSREANGETFHGDHGYAQFYIPQNARNWPIIMWHGIGQSGRSFESTPDGREGYQALLTRDDWPVYIIDQPRRGRAGRTRAEPAVNNIPTTTNESGVWSAFRLGRWLPPEPATLYPVSQFPRDGAAIDQFMRQQTGDTGELPRTPEHRTFMAKAMKDLLERTGPGILLTHSYGGQFGWGTGMESPELVKAIVAYEPGQYVFPEHELPPDVASPLEIVNTNLCPQPVPLEEFRKLTRMPILIVFGDNIAQEPGEVFNEEVWRVSFARAKQFVDAINRHGGHAELLHLPEIGIRGNSHAPFADANNGEIAGLLERWLAEKGLDARDAPHRGPRKKEMPFTIPLAGE